jgi:hypothetical protein
MVAAGGVGVTRVDRHCGCRVIKARQLVVLERRVMSRAAEFPLKVLL